MKHLYIFAIFLFSFSAFSYAQIMPGQIDEFTDGTDAWLRGDAIEGKLVLTADGMGSSGKLVTFNQAQWGGDYLTESITHIRMTISNPSTENLSMRVALGNGTNANSGTWYASTEAIEVSAGSIDQVLEFSIAEADLTLVEGSTDYATVFGNIATFRILHSASPSAQGDVVVAEISLDNIEALSQTTEISDKEIEHFSFYPNPAFDNLTIEVDEDALIEVFDLTGKRIRSLHAYKGSNSIDLSNWISGIYILRISNENETISKRLIVE